jgi:hypothetical protein
MSEMTAIRHDFADAITGARSAYAKMIFIIRKSYPRARRAQDFTVVFLDLGRP